MTKQRERLPVSPLLGLILIATAILVPGTTALARAADGSGGRSGGAVDSASRPSARLSGALRYALHNSRRSPGADTSGSTGAAHGGIGSMLSRNFLVGDAPSGPTATFKAVLSTGSPAEIAGIIAAGGRIRGHVGRVVSFSAPLDRAESFARLGSILSLDLAHRMKPELDVSVPETGAAQVHDPNSFGATGAGVLVASVDTGHDLKHADFRNADGTTRFKSVFNLDSACSGLPPPGHTEGCYFDEARINKFLRGKGGVSYTDPAGTFGHGTHTFATAAGNGLATGRGFPAGRYVGMAPDADLIGVKLFDDRGNQTGDVTEALEFLVEEQARLGNPPLVVNMSFGHQFGAHDGTDPDEMSVDTLADEGDANNIVRMFIKSAGNAELDGIYLQGTAAQGLPALHTFRIPPFDGSGRSCGSLSGRGNDEVFMDMWYEGADSLTIKITAPNGTTSFQNSTGNNPNNVALDTSSGTIFVDCPSTPYPFNDDRECIFGVDDSGGVVPVSGVWTVTVTGVNIAAGGRYDIWIADATKGSCTWGWDNPSTGSSVSIPGTSARGITVGAYLTKIDWTDVAGRAIQYTDPSFVLMDIAPFSSTGPTRDNRIKPDIAAPGMGIASAKAKKVSVTAARTRIVEDGKHMVLEGTSMSAPHVAGAAALLLSINPLLDADTVRQILLDNATVDSFTSGVPNQTWGFGKLNVFAAANDPRVRAARRPLPPVPLVNP